MAMPNRALEAISPIHPATGLALRKQRGQQHFPGSWRQLQDLNCTLRSSRAQKVPDKGSVSPSPLFRPSDSLQLLPLGASFGHAGLSPLYLQESPKESNSEAGVTATPHRAAGAWRQLPSENAPRILQNVCLSRSPATAMLGFLLDINFLSSVSTGAALSLNYVLE